MITTPCHALRDVWLTVREKLIAVAAGMNSIEIRDIIGYISTEYDEGE